MKSLVKFGLLFVFLMFLSSAVFAHPGDDVNYNKYLIKSLNDENVGIRSSAAQLLGERKVEEAVKPLMKMLKNEKNYSLRIVAALSLYQISDEKALPILKEAAKIDKNKTARKVLTGLVQEIETSKFAKK